MPPTETQLKIMKAAYRKPSITAYNRLEATPRDTDLDQSLRAEIRDPLWMLTRQWQFGEFEGEDAASAVSSVILGEHTPVNQVRLGSGPVTGYDVSIPLEVAVEAERLKDNLSLAVEISRYFIKLIRSKLLDETYILRLNAFYSLTYQIRDNDIDAVQLSAVMKPKFFDGCALLRDINTPSGSGNKFTVWLNAQGLPSTDITILTGLSVKLTEWYSRNYNQPAGGLTNQAWQSPTLDYSFSLQTPSNGQSQKMLSASQFYGGHLDWYAFDADSQVVDPTRGGGVADNNNGNSAVQENLVSFIPTPVAFKGMPDPRFWAMEDGQTDFGKIDTSATGLLHLLLAEFGLIYGNDWFMLPYPLAINNICEIKGLIVTDTFGQHTMIDAAGAGSDNSWQRWAMFHQSDINTQTSPNKIFYLAPSITRSLNNDPLEQVNFLRDEVADMVWAVEDSVPSQSGKGMSGNEMALRTDAPPPFIPAGTASIRYILGTTVPDNWTPFIPVHIEGSITEIQLQRAKMPGAKGPFGEIISETPAPYYIHEEEVPRAGTIVSRAFRRARWLNGKTYLWIGRTRETGKGEGWGNLKFDQIVDILPNKSTQ